MSSNSACARSTDGAILAAPSSCLPDRSSLLKRLLSIVLLSSEPHRQHAILLPPQSPPEGDTVAFAC
jgi:hypothetical protein